MRADQRSDPFDPSSPSFGAASSSSPTDHVPHPGLARAWANSEQRGQPAVWPPASAGQPPNMHLGHPGTPTAQHPFAHHPFGAGAGYGCAAARLFLLAHDRVVVVGARAVPLLPLSRTQPKLAPPGTARTPKSCTATPLRPSTRAAPCSIRRDQQHAWRGPTAASTVCLASCMRSASRQVSDRTHTHDHIATSPTPSTLPPRFPASRSTRAITESLACVAGVRGSWHEGESYDQEDL